MITNIGFNGFDKLGFEAKIYLIASNILIFGQDAALFCNSKPEGLRSPPTFTSLIPVMVVLNCAACLEFRA